MALDLADVTWNRDGSAAVLIRRSKTDQAGQGETRWLAPVTVARLRAWLTVAGIHEGPIFRAVNKAGAAGGALTGGDVPRILKRLAALAPDLDPAAVSGHSCRVGMAQDLVAAGEELAGVMQAGRWRSPMMPARYAEKLEAGRGAVRWRGSTGSGAPEASLRAACSASHWPFAGHLRVMPSSVDVHAWNPRRPRSVTLRVHQQRT